MLVKRSEVLELKREVAFLTVHSMLHLLGYDHENGGLEQTIMREKEEAVLDLYFAVRRFISVYEVMGEEYRIYTDYTERRITYEIPNRPSGRRDGY